MPKSPGPMFALMIVVLCGAVALGRSRAVQSLLAHADGFVVTVDQPSQVFEAHPDTKIPVRFVFQSHADRPVTIVGVSTGCSCTVSQNVPVTLPPHESVEIVLEVSTHGDQPGDVIDLSPEFYLDCASRRQALSIRVNVVR